MKVQYLFKPLFRTFLLFCLFQCRNEHVPKIYFSHCLLHLAFISPDAIEDPLPLMTWSFSLSLYHSSIYLSLSLQFFYFSLSLFTILLFPSLFTILLFLSLSLQLFYFSLYPFTLCLSPFIFTPYLHLFWLPFDFCTFSIKNSIFVNFLFICLCLSVYEFTSSSVLFLSHFSMERTIDRDKKEELNVWECPKMTAKCMFEAFGWPALEWHTHFP